MSRLAPGNAAAPYAWAPWTDKKGRLHPLRAVTFVLLLLPALWLGLREMLHMLGAEPIKTATHSTGYWAVAFLIASMMVSPAKALLGMPGLIVLRRMIGVAALGYALIHLALYAADESWRPLVVITEILSRFYLTIGFVALVGLVVLGVTSTDGAIRRMGKQWKSLHRWVYGVAGLALIHFLLQTKADVSLPLMFVGIFYWLMIWRALPAGRDRSPAAIVGLTLAAAVLTGITEWCWYRFATHIDSAKVMRSELDTSFGLHPVGQILALGAALVLVLQLRRLSLGPLGQRAWFWIGIFALGAATTEFAVFVFGIDRFLDPDDYSWLWQDLAWAGLLGVLGAARWHLGDSARRYAFDALGATCVAFQIMLAADGLRSVSMALAGMIVCLWALLAWQSWPRTKLAALCLVPLGLVVSYGVEKLM